MQYQNKNGLSKKKEFQLECVKSSLKTKKNLGEYIDQLRFNVTAGFDTS